MDDLLSDFLTEVSEGLAELDNALLTLERTPGDANTLSLIFRQVHTIKGTCGFLGLSRLERVAHAAEDVLGRVRDGELQATPPVVDLVLAALDRIKLIVGVIAETGGEIEGDDSPLIARLRAMAEGVAAPAPEAEHVPEVAPVPDAAPVPEGARVKRERRKPTRVRAARVVKAPLPEAPVAAPPAGSEVVPGGAPEAASPAASSTGSPTSSPASGAQAAAGRAAEGRGGTEAVLAQTIRVGVDTLEALMTLVGELVLTRNQLMQLARAQNDSTLAMPLQRLSRLTSELQESVMKTRMQPIGNAWNKLPRLVRDLGAELGKPIELEMHGAETELDRQVLEQIRDPLTHVVRNAADHGLETAAQRRACGKPETGRIVLRAFHEGGHVVLEISDDGRGLDAERIKTKALGLGLTTEAELASMTDAQIQRFIFLPGFSTSASVTAVSGRGVGMDVVRTNIERINGAIDLRSVPGLGTTLAIRIPLTLAIVPGLIVAAGGERFVVPQLSVVELVRPNEERGRADAVLVDRIGGTKMLRLRERLLPLVDLPPALGLDPSVKPEADKVVVVAQAGGAMFGIVVDDVFDTEEIVVKPVAPPLRHLALFSGNTILGDGAVIMILDPGGLARTIGLEAGQGQLPETSAAASDAARTPMLLFKANGGVKAVPLDAVSRLELLDRKDIEQAGGVSLVQYRGRLMPVVALGGDPSSEQLPVLVFRDSGRSVALMVDEIIDIVEEEVTIELAAGLPGILGTAVLAGRATDVIDQSYWLAQASSAWSPLGYGQAQFDALPKGEIANAADADLLGEVA